MSEMSYPALYHEASSASDAKQRFYLRLIKGEYAALFAVSVLGLGLSEEQWYFIIYGLAFAVPFALLLARSFLKPEQGWYQSRALAESIKTSTWKYVMRAPPFEGADSVQVPRATFRNHLKAILQANAHVGRQFDSTAAHLEQITDRMDEIRSWDTETRKNFYLTHRVDDQRKWYARKAGLNRRWSRRAVAVLCALYALAAGAVLTRAAYPKWDLSNPDPLVVLASALVGWMQIKKFNELATSYGLTAHEIGLVKADAIGVSTDEQLAAFVDDAEQAFSREHTQWVARQSQ